ncbi:MAG: archaeosortase/exosortase family protein [Candidatus Nanohaloarchaea archaeon]|nr:archaeosortase/exosortase family protein [Candidatus Nanohaloarchaea archaeon]
MAGRIQSAVTARIERLRERYAAFEDRLTGQQQSLLDAVVFLTKFTLLAAPFWLVLHGGWQAEGVRTATAHGAAVVLQVLGIDASATGHLLSTGTLIVDVTRDSTGWKSVMVFIALVAASDRPLRSRVAAAVAGTATLLAVNLLRIVSMVYAVVVFGVEYELLHTVLWRWGLTAAVILLWTGWLWRSGVSQRLSVPPIR